MASVHEETQVPLPPWLFLKALAPLLAVVALTELPTAALKWGLNSSQGAERAGSMFLQSKTAFLKQTSVSWSTGWAHHLVWGSVSAASLLGKEQHICLSFLSQTQKTFISVSDTPLAVTSLHHLLPSSQDLSNQGKSLCSKAMLKVTLLSPRRCHSPVCSARLQMGHSPPDQMSERKCHLLFCRAPSLLAVEKSLTHSPYKQNAGCWIMYPESEHI